tara:strand:- start:52917 stop:53849 length:933 start_codon:yes stop_codon:yes gene_type:complete
MALIITADGIDALASAESTGVKLQATHMAVGDGNGNAVAHTSESPSLINERWRGELQEIKKKNAGEVEFTAHVPFTVGDWYVREVAIYAGDVLLAIGSHPEVWKPAPEAPDKLELLICAPVVFGNTDNISVTVDSTKVLASQEYVAGEFTKHNGDVEAHGGVLIGAATHASAKDNPHNVTAEQVGAAANNHVHPEYASKADAEHNHDIGEILNIDSLWSENLAENGYTVLPSGLILQWGNTIVSPSSSTVTFPLAFPNGCCSVVASLGQDYGTIGNEAVTTHSFTLTQFTIRAEIGSGVSPKVYWFAIGY